MNFISVSYNMYHNSIDITYYELIVIRMKQD